MLRGLKVFDFIKMQHRVLSINLGSRFIFRISTSHPGNLSGRLVLTQPHFLMISINSVIFSFWTVKFWGIEGKQNVLDSECAFFSFFSFSENHISEICEASSVFNQKSTMRRTKIFCTEFASVLLRFYSANVVLVIRTHSDWNKPLF